MCYYSYFIENNLKFGIDLEGYTNSQIQGWFGFCPTKVFKNIISYILMFMVRVALDITTFEIMLRT